MKDLLDFTSAERDLRRIALLALAYFVSGRLGLLVPYVGDNITLIWPPTGIAVATLLRGGNRYWPGVWLGAFLVNLSVGSPATIAAMIAVGNTLGPATAVTLLRRVGFKLAFERRVDVLYFVFTAALACMAVNATVGVTTLASAGIVPPAAALLAWLTWWFGDVAGVLIVAPPLLSLSLKPWRSWFTEHGAFEFLAMSAAVIAATIAVFIPRASSAAVSLAFIPIPLLIALAMRHGVQRTSLVVLCIASIAVVATASGRGPFHSAMTHQSLMLIWSYVIIVTVIALLITALQTEMLAAQRALQEEQQRLARIIEGTQAGTWEWNVQTGETRFNAQWARMIGYSLEELGKTTIETWVENSHPDDLAISGERLERHFAGQSETYECEVRMRHRDGHWMWVLDRGRVQTWTADGKPEWMFGTHIECTLRRQQEEALRKSQALLNRTGEVAGIGGWAIELATGEVTWSDQTCRIHGLPLGYKPTVAEAIKFYAPEARETIRAAIERGIAEGAGWDLELPFVQADGRRIWVKATGACELENGKTVRLIGAFQDITARRRAEEQLAQSQKLEALGQLTGGLAHDYNNILGIVLGSLDMLSEYPHGDEARELIATARSAAQRGTEVSKPLLALSRREALAPETVDVHALLRELAPLLTQTAGKRIDVVVEMLASNAFAVLESGGFNNALLNIVINARDAMPNGGCLQIRTDNMEIDADDALSLPRGQYLVVLVRDNGTGMSPEVAARAFDPFFTTKHRGKGTGLGLSTVYGFAQRSGGKATIETMAGEGTSVRLILPRATAHGRAGNCAPPENTPATPPRGSERILIVDDEVALRQLVSMRLASLGYRTTTAGSADEALSALQGQPFDLLLSDVVMPGAFDGVELAVRARAACPAMRIVMVSGFADADLTRIPGSWRLLDKPIDRDQLALQVRAALDEAPPSDGDIAAAG